MTSPSPLVVLVSGASSGIGKAIAECLHARGHRVYGTSRHAPRAVALAASGTGSDVVPLIPMDVTSDDSVERAIGIVLAQEGRLDVVVNNAGMGIAGAVEHTTVAEARGQFETNFFGVVRVCRAALPVLRRQGAGWVINVSSIAGVIGVPYQAFYTASKFAVEGFSEALRMEVAPFGIRVVLVEPGDFRTNFTGNRTLAEEARGATAYASRQAAALAVMQADETGGATPEAVGRLVDRIVRARRPRLRYPVGPFSERLALAFRRFAPSALFEWTIARYYKTR